MPERRVFARSQAPTLAVIYKSGKAEKIRHFGRDAEIQAMDGNNLVVQMLDSGNMPSRSLMFTVAGISVVAPISLRVLLILSSLC